MLFTLYLPLSHSFIYGETCNLSICCSLLIYHYHILYQCFLPLPQYYYDALEAEAWMSEQELYMMGEERTKDENGAQNMMKKHQALETAVEDYYEVVRELGERSRNLMEYDHPER